MAKQNLKQPVIYEWVVCPFETVDDQLKTMRAAGWHPVSHAIWHDVKTCTLMASFIFKKRKEQNPEDNVLGFIKKRVDRLRNEV